MVVVLRCPAVAGACGGSSGAAFLGLGWGVGRRTSLTLKCILGLGPRRACAGTSGLRTCLGVKGKCASEGISCLALARAIDFEALVYSRLTSREWCEKQPQSSKNPLGSGWGQAVLLSLCGKIPFVLCASQTKQSKNLLSETARRTGHKI